MDYSTFLAREYFGNTIENYLIALLIVVGAALLAKFFKIQAYPKPAEPYAQFEPFAPSGSVITYWHS